MTTQRSKGACWLVCEGCDAESKVANGNRACAVKEAELDGWVVHEGKDLCRSCEADRVTSLRAAEATAGMTADEVAEDVYYATMGLRYDALDSVIGKGRA